MSRFHKDQVNCPWSRYKAPTWHSFNRWTLVGRLDPLGARELFFWCFDDMLEGMENLGQFPFWRRFGIQDFFPMIWVRVFIHTLQSFGKRESKYTGFQAIIFEGKMLCQNVQSGVFFWWNNFIHVLAMNEEYHRFLLSTCQLKKRPTSMSCFFLTCWPKWPKFAATNVLSPSVPTSTRRAKVQSEICLGKGRVRRMFACPRSG